MFVLKSWLGLAVVCVAGLVAAVVITAIVAVIVRLVARRKEWARSLTRHARRPFRVLLVVVAFWIAVAITLPEPGWAPTVWHGFLILTIVAGGWFAAALVFFLEDLGLNRYRLDVPDNRVARRLRTQVLILRRVTVVGVVVITLGAILLTFPEVQTVGASVLASAGILSIIGGVAAQSTLSNIFAGIQLAFSDAIRVDDVVVVENQWGRIEEITLTYIVVHIWDDRRLVMPSKFFTSTPFENWTRHNSELLGAVEFDLDWRADPARMRTQLDAILATTELWDQRVAVLQVTDAVGGLVRIRILVTAADAPRLFDLRCFVREEMIAWLHASSPQSIPRTRVELKEAGDDERDAAGGSGAKPPAELREPTGPTGLFSGDADAEQRASHFTGLIPVIERDAEREEAAEEAAAEETAAESGPASSRREEPGPTGPS